MLVGTSPIAWLLVWLSTAWPLAAKDAGICQAPPARQDPLICTPEHESRRDRSQRLLEVRWTVTEDLPLATLASLWGLEETQLLRLNPELRPGRRVPVGKQLRVYRQDPRKLPKSIGFPHRGKLRNAIPMPEGPTWRLRRSRKRAWGTAVTVTTLLQVLGDYGRKWPDAPILRFGELSRRRGGRLPPHRSHRTGRDVDIGYALTGPDDGSEIWKQATEANFDAERNWFVIKSLVQSGKVETIFIAKRLQRLLLPLARRDFPPDEVAKWFRAATDDHSSFTILRHSRGHGDHMHVRFRCAAEDLRCRTVKGERADP